MNNREIKFRVWDDDNETMLFDDGREQIEIIFYSGKPAVVHHFQEKNISRDGIEMDVPTAEQVMDFTLMQFTGIKDKNNKGIYKDDILFVLGYGYAIVIWNEDVCAFQYAYHAIGIGTSIGGRMTNTLYRHLTNEYEVIGNIYENPELIKVNP